MDGMDNEKKPYSRAGRKVLIPLKAPSERQRKAIKEHAWMFGWPHAQSSVPGGGDGRLNDRTRKSLSLQQWWCRVKDVAPLLEQAKRPSQENTKPGETRHLPKAKPRTSDPCVRQVARLQVGNSDTHKIASLPFVTSSQSRLRNMHRPKDPRFAQCSSRLG